MCKYEIAGFGHDAVFEFCSSGTFRTVCWYFAAYVGTEICVFGDISQLMLVLR